jgi:hypothetical protein
MTKPHLALLAPNAVIGTVLGHRNIQHTVRYTELAPPRFKNFRHDDRAPLDLCS